MNDNGLSSDSLTLEELAGMLTQEGEATPVSKVLRFYDGGQKVLYKPITVIII